MDFVEDGRSFALADLDGDGRLEVILKNRNAPQLRILHNAMKGIGGSIAFRLRGTKSNRDAIGAAVTVEAGPLKQTRYLQAGSGFLAQHSKELHFGLGDWKGVVRATVRWPSGLAQTLEGLPAESRIEVEEGSNRFTARPFGPTATTYGHPATPALVESLPTQVGTWLIEPLIAPVSSLPDLAGATHDLQSLRGSLVLMTFWSASAPASVEVLRALHQRRTQLEGARLEILAVNVDQAGELPKPRVIAAQEKFYFPLLQATEEVAGIYNIIYRYLFDRRRDLGLPTSFLLDREGRIVKVYQGPIDAHALLDDLRSIPQTAAERMLKAIPMNGDLYQRAFVRDDFTYGVALFQHGYLEPAAESFKQVIAAKPNDPEGYYNLGTLNLRRNNFDEARQYLEKSLELRPNYPEAWNNLGMMAAQGGKADEAIRNFEKSLQLRPGYAIALLNLGNVYRRQKEFDKAQDCLSRALKLQPDDPEIHYSLGMLFAQQGQVQRAADSLTRALELRPGYPEAMNNLGVLYVRAQELSKAEQQFRKCIELEPGFDQSYLNLARLYEMQGDREKARRAVQDLLAIQPDNANARQAMEMLQ
jgi:tetratricopeptide (TPR) repeat protein